MTTTSDGGDADGGSSQNGIDAIADMSLYKLALSVCEAIEQGDDAMLASLLDVTQAVVGTKAKQPPMPTTVEDKPRVVALLRVFYNLLGQNFGPHGTLSEGEIMTYDLSVRAPLVLKALFRVSSMDLNMSSISW